MRSRHNDDEQHNDDDALPRSLVVPKGEYRLELLGGRRPFLHANRPHSIRHLLQWPVLHRGPLYRWLRRNDDNDDNNNYDHHYHHHDDDNCRSLYGNLRLDVERICLGGCGRKYMQLRLPSAGW